MQRIKWTQSGTNYYSHGRLYEIRYCRDPEQYQVHYDGLPISAHPTYAEAEKAAEDHAVKVLKSDVIA